MFVFQLYDKNMFRASLKAKEVTNVAREVVLTSFSSPLVT
jgi:hypothetical protein